MNICVYVCKLTRYFIVPFCLVNEIKLSRENEELQSWNSKSLSKVEPQKI